MRKSIPGRSSDQSPSRVVPFFNLHNNKATEASLTQNDTINIQYNSDNGANQRGNLNQQYYQAGSLEQINLGSHVNQDLRGHRMVKDRIQQSSTQFMKKNPYFNNAANARQVADDQGGTALGIKKSFEVASHGPGGANRYYYSSKTEAEHEHGVHHATEQSMRQGRNFIQPVQSSNQITRPKPPSAHRMIKTSTLSQGLHMNPEIDKQNLQVLHQGGNQQQMLSQPNINNKSLNRTFYNQQSSASKLQQLPQDHHHLAQ